MLERLKRSWRPRNAPVYNIIDQGTSELLVRRSRDHEADELHVTLLVTNTSFRKLQRFLSPTASDFTLVAKAPWSKNKNFGLFWFEKSRARKYFCNKKWLLWIVDLDCYVGTRGVRKWNEWHLWYR